MMSRDQACGPGPSTPIQIKYSGNSGYERQPSRKSALGSRKQENHINEMISSIGIFYTGDGGNETRGNIRKSVPAPKQPEGTLPKNIPIDACSLSQGAIISWKEERQRLATNVFERLEMKSKEREDRERKVKLEFKKQALVARKAELEKVTFLRKLQEGLDRKLERVMTEEEGIQIQNQEYENDEEEMTNYVLTMKDYDYRRPTMVFPLLDMSCEGLQVSDQGKESLERCRNQPDFGKQSRQPKKLLPPSDSTSSTQLFG